MAATTNQMKLLHQLTEKRIVVSEIPTDKIAEVNKFIKKGAKERRVNWSNAITLVHWAFKQSRVELPGIDITAAWKQYESAIEYAVRALSDARGINGSWRTSYTESLDVTNFKVTVKHGDLIEEYAVNAVTIKDALKEVEKVLGDNFPTRVTRETDSLCEGVFTYMKMVDLDTKFTIEKMYE